MPFPYEWSVENDRAPRHRLTTRWPIWFLLMAMAAMVVAMGFQLSPFSPADTVRHLAAFPNCAAARAVGLGEARRGAPGYWPHLDRDQDGIACEPWHGWRMPAPRRSAMTPPL